MSNINTIVSLAILKTNWKERSTDYLDSFVPFMVQLIYQKNYSEIQASTIHKDFTDEYGIVLPYHPCITLLNRVKKRGFIRQLNHK